MLVGKKCHWRKSQGTKSKPKIQFLYQEKKRGKHKTFWNYFFWVSYWIFIPFLASFFVGFHVFASWVRCIMQTHLGFFGVLFMVWWSRCVLVFFLLNFVLKLQTLCVIFVVNGVVACFLVCSVCDECVYVQILGYLLKFDDFWCIYYLLALIFLFAAYLLVFLFVIIGLRWGWYVQILGDLLIFDGFGVSVICLVNG